VKRAVLALLALVLGGCVSTYDGVDTTLTMAATVSFSKGYRSQLAVSGSTVYGVYENRQCETMKTVARLLWTTPDSKAIPVAASQRLIVHAETTYFYSEYGGVSSATCKELVSFIPEAGHSYDISQESTLGRGFCKTLVIDKATGKPPTTLRKSAKAPCQDHLAPEAPEEQKAAPQLT
jgi:hypothetical protein